MKRLFAFLGDCHIRRRSVAALAILQMTISALTISLSQILKMGVDSIQSADLSLLKMAGIGGVIAALLLVAFEAADKLCLVRLQNRGTLQLQARLMDRLVSTKKIQLDRLSAGRVMTVVINNASGSVTHSLECLVDAAKGFCTVLLVTAYMLWLEWKIAGILLCGMIFLRLLARLAFKKQKQFGRRAVSAEKETSSFLTDWLSNMMTVRLFDFKGFFAKKLRQREQTLLVANMKRNYLSNFLSDGTWAFVKLLEFFVIYGLGACFIYQGMTTAGVLIAFTFAFDVLMKGLDLLTHAQSSRAEALAQIESVEELLNTSQLEDGRQAALPDSPFSIRVSGVRFGYTEHPVLENVSFTILPGEKVLLRGPNGQGKSTLLKLLAGLYRPDAGSIEFGEQNMGAIHLQSLSQVYSYISQESVLFSDGVRENLALSREYDRGRADRVLEELRLASIGENDPLSLSQGERQRLNIGRALYRSSRPLILGDEIFANIDAQNAAHILGLLKTAFAGCTVILVSHDALDFPFSRVLTVEDGKVLQEVCRV
ncbi:MAG: ABC transporter ATP-binding protein [Provencibacterium sp.]|jgi:ABC-type bacteriocin/lantibiotic exporter with double-glycine peptidase domain|nr:ABC transporter ATP-binding protein [Provencibacterium sp.]